MSARASLIYLSTRVITGVLSLTTISIFSRGLGPEDYGWLTLATAIGALSVGFLLQPLQQSLARFLPRAGSENLVPTLACMLWCFIFVGLLAATLIEVFAASWLPVGVVLAGWALGSAQGLFDFSAQHSNSTLRPGRYALMYGLKSALVATLGYAALTLGFGKTGALLTICVAYTVTALTVNLACWKIAWSGPWSLQAFHTIKGYALPLGATFFVSSLLQWADRLIIGVLLGSQGAGLYGVAADLTQQTLGLLSGAFFLAWYPRILTAFEQKHQAELKQLASRYATSILFLMLPAALGFALVRKNLAPMLLGDAFVDDAIAVIPWLSAAAVLAGLRTYLFELPHHLSGRMNVLLRNVSLCAAWAIFLNLVLVNEFGLIGAGMAAVLTQATGCALAVVSARGVVRWRIAGKDVVGVLSASAAMVVAIVFVDETGLVGLSLQVGIGTALYFFILWLLDVGNCRRSPRSFMAFGRKL